MTTNALFYVCVGKVIISSNIVYGSPLFVFSTLTRTLPDKNYCYLSYTSHKGGTEAQIEQNKQNILICIMDIFTECNDYWMALSLFFYLRKVA